MLNGIDIASYQHGIDIESMPDVQAMMCKATEATGYVSPDCDPQYRQAVARRIPRGVYHYAGSSVSHTIGDANAEADYFLKHVAGYVHDAVLMLDWEPYGYNMDGASMARWIKAWTDRVHATVGVWPVIYMDGNHVSIIDQADPATARAIAKNCALIVAGGPSYETVQGFNPTQNGRPFVPSYWTVFGWQYTSHGRLNGWAGNLDLNVYYVTPDQWTAYAKGSSTVAPAPKPTPKPPAPKPTPPPARTYTVVSGDTLSKIAARFGTTWQRLAMLNHLPDPDVIIPGQVLHIDTAAPEAPKPRPRTYVVTGRDSDGLAAAMARIGVGNWKAVADLNGLHDPYIIHPGDVLRLP